MQISKKQLKQGIIFSVSVSILAIILVFILTRGEFSLHLLSKIQLPYLFLAACITLIFWGLKALKFKSLTASLDQGISFQQAFAIYLGSAFVAHVTPSSSGGLPFQVYFLHQEGLSLGQSTALSMMENITNLVFFIIATPVLLVLWRESLNLNSLIIRLVYFAVFLVVLFLIISPILIFHPQWARKFIDWLINLKLSQRLFSEDSLRKFQNFINRELNYFKEGISLFMRKKKAVFLVSVYTIIYWIFYLSLAPILLRGLGLEIPIPPVILAQLVFNLIQPVIPTPGGSGGAELSFAYLFKFLIPGSLLGIFVSIWRIFMFYASLIIGGLFFIKLVQGTDFIQSAK